MKNNNEYNDEALRTVIEHKMRTSEGSRLSDDFADTKKQPESTWLRVANTISSIAAALLVGYFIMLHLPSSTKTEQTYTYYNIASLPKSSTLEQVYTGHRGQMNDHQLSYTHFKRMIYEHK